MTTSTYIQSSRSKMESQFLVTTSVSKLQNSQIMMIIEEKKAIKEFVVDLKKPYLGFCLGCQLLGEVVGGKVVKSNPAEIGIMDINFTQEKAKDNLFSEFPGLKKRRELESGNFNTTSS